jgi:hypothetical protein
MDGTALGLLGALTGCATVAALRWSRARRPASLASARPPDTRLSPIACRPLALRSSRVAAVLPESGLFKIIFEELVRGVPERRDYFVAGEPTPEMVARVDEWHAAGTTLMLLTDEHGDTSVLGPDGVTTGLHLVDALV